MLTADVIGDHCDHQVFMLLVVDEIHEAERGGEGLDPQSNGRS